MHVICPPIILWVLVVSYEIGKELGKKVALNDTSAANNDVTELTRMIHALMKRSWRVEFALIQRTANHVADTLAKYAVVQNVDQVKWLIPNDDLKELLKHDFLD
ncbi:hypothetical protein PIB30_082748 [Stylosanthes scabra]|uniref:RNase H type-1 domain-containing protein n=1 Tax=Stylosanthes scabra TaxID=79078 RepID=A0ABU6ZQS5_9FABA|nr:hypothetical protein [Stylosanthes scabra]